MEKLNGKLPFISLATFIAIVFLSCTGRVGNFSRISPQQANFSPEKLKVVKQYLEQNKSAAFLGLYDGKVFFSWG